MAKGGRLSDNAVHYPDERPHHVRSVAVAGSLFIGLVAFALANALASLFVYKADAGGQLISAKWDLLEHLSEPVDWLVLGDSSANQGVDPEILSAQIGGRSVNLATVGNVLVVNDVWMLQRYAERFGPPRNVVVVHVYDVWPRGVDPAVFAHVPLHAVRNGNPGLSLGWQGSVNHMLHRYLPLYGAFPQFFRIGRNPGLIFEPGLAVSENGFLAVADPNPQQVQRDVRAHQRFVAENRYNVSMPNETAIDALVRFAERNEVDVYLANSPIAYGLWADPSFQAYFESVDGLLKSLDDRSPQIHYVLREPAVFPNAEMENADHVTEEGARTYTRQLAESVIDRASSELR